MVSASSGRAGRTVRFISGFLAREGDVTQGRPCKCATSTGCSLAMSIQGIAPSARDEARRSRTDTERGPVADWMEFSMTGQAAGIFALLDATALATAKTLLAPVADRLGTITLDSWFGSARLTSLRDPASL